MGAGQDLASASHCTTLFQWGMPTESNLLHADLSMPAKVGRLNLARICTTGRTVTSYGCFSCSENQHDPQAQSPHVHNGVSVQRLWRICTAWAYPTGTSSLRTWCSATWALMPE